MSTTGGFPDLSQLLATAQRIQGDMARAKEALATKTVDAESGGGLVKCVANGQGDIVSLVIDPVALAGDARMIQDLVVAAVNLAIERARQLAHDEMARATGGLGIPPGFLGGLGG